MSTIWNTEWRNGGAAFEATENVTFHVTRSKWNIGKFVEAPETAWRIFTGGGSELTLSEIQL